MLETRIAKDLLRIGAVFFRPDEPFTWASGIQSPVYCDNRLTLTAPDVRTDVEEGLKSLVETHYPDAEVLMGTSTAGIAHAAITAHLMGLPMGYVRSGRAEVLGIVSIFTYGMQKGLDRLAEAKVGNVSLTNFDVIARVAAEEGYIREEDVRRLIAFRDHPEDESWREA